MNQEINSKPTLLFFGPVGTRSGYGAHSRDLALAFIELGKFKVQIFPIPWGATPNNALDGSIAEHQKIISHIVNTIPNDVPDVFVHVTIPSEFHRRGKLNIGVTAGIETTTPHPSWVDGCNRMDLIITTSKHSLHTLQGTEYDIPVDQRNPNLGTRRLKLLKPIVTLFEGVDTSLYKKTKSLPESSLKYALNSIKENFCFLFVGTWIHGDYGADRKDIGRMVDVFCTIFRNKIPSKRPALILKTSGAGNSILDKNIILDKLQMVFKKYNGLRPNVYLLHGDLTEQEMNLLYNHHKVKAMVSLTHGEGFGRPLLEFTTTGKPVLASGWSGHLDFLHLEYSCLVPGELKQVPESACNEWIIPQSKWFVADYEKAAALLLDVFQNYSIYLEKGEKQRRHTLAHFTFKHMVDELSKILERGPSQVTEAVGSSIKTMQEIKLPKLTKIT